jgi:hypothetical protein
MIERNFWIGGMSAQFWFCFITRPLMFFLSQVFRDVEPESEDENENTEPVCLSMAARMKLQAAAAAKEKAANGLMDATNMGTVVEAAAPAVAAASRV